MRELDRTMACLPSDLGAPKGAIFHPCPGSPHGWMTRVPWAPETFKLLISRARMPLGQQTEIP